MAVISGMVPTWKPRGNQPNTRQNAKMHKNRPWSLPPALPGATRIPKLKPKKTTIKLTTTTNFLKAVVSGLIPTWKPRGNLRNTRKIPDIHKNMPWSLPVALPGAPCIPKLKPKENNH